MSAGFNDSAARQPHFPRWDELLECSDVGERLNTVREDDNPVIIAICLDCPLADCRPGARSCPLTGGLDFWGLKRQREKSA